ncbi:MAG: bifunctional riboflavin kinase/FAD synthetase [Acholeplasma sp.]|nr:bifunctional riboflavin kinase/FAD synthetase [Acholeplasma sp.]
MKTFILDNINTWPKLKNLTLTIGNFDGVHLGHQKLLNKVTSYTDTMSAAMTMNPHPSSVFKDKNYQTLISVDVKKELISKFNVDYLFVVNFDVDFYTLSVEQFINKLIELGVKRIVLGKDFRFAHKGLGIVNDLLPFFEVISVDDVKLNSYRISTTLIKELIQNGNITEANACLGYKYFIKGFVEHGNKVGKTLGFPTANINYKEAFLPKNGVYLVRLLIDEKYHYGICNIGNNPTINFSKIRKVEVFILDYNEVIYDKDVKLEFITFIRDEKKFSSKEDLIDAINNDEKVSRNIIKNTESMIK